MRCRLAACGESLEASAVHQKNIEPTVVVVIVEGNSAAGSFKQVFVLVLAAKNGLGIESRVLRNIDKADANINGLRTVFCRGRFLLKSRKGACPLRPRQCQHV